ncbi:MAG: helix-turn-helix transcriptional regulator [Bacteroidia bacterium]
MPINKQALIRYNTIDQCLQNRTKRWTLEDLMEACSEALFKFEGISKGISKRSIQLDIQNMRSEKLGYNAPIIVIDKKYYSYSDKDYSITNTPLTGQDLGTLNEVLNILKQFKGFNHFQDLNTLITKLEDKLNLHSQKGKSYIQFEKNDLLKGIHHIDGLHQAIKTKTCIEIKYKSFKSKTESSFLFHPFLLKEYRNRWFLLGLNNKRKVLMILALDRIEDFYEVKKIKYIDSDFNPNTYFDDVIGVSKLPGQKPIEIIMELNKVSAPYIKTKPIHQSQKILKETESSLLISIRVIWNYELEREILGFGEDIKILSPKRLKGKIYSRIKKCYQLYEADFLEAESTQSE